MNIVTPVPVTISILIRHFRSGLIIAPLSLPFQILNIKEDVNPPNTMPINYVNIFIVSSKN